MSDTCHPLERTLLRLGFFLRDRSATRLRLIAPGIELECRLGSRYETMVWWEREEREELTLLARRLRRGDTFVDCGANVGLWSLVAADRVGPGGTVLAFEAHPRTAARLERVVRRSSLPFVTVYNAAVGDTNGTVSFLESTEHNMQSLLRTSGSIRITTPLLTIDRLELPALHGMKIDVEGYEDRVVLGASRSIAEHHPWIIVEYNPHYLVRRRLAEWKTHRMLTSLGYAAFVANVSADASARPLPDSWTAPRYVNLLYRYVGAPELDEPMRG